MSLTMQDYMDEIHRCAVEKGWWSQDRPIGEIIALIHSEASEALEEWRDGHELGEIYFVGEKPEGFPIELADIIIRVLDVCAGFGLDIEEALGLKMTYNWTRPYKHGGKRI